MILCVRCVTLSWAEPCKDSQKFNYQLFWLSSPNQLKWYCALGVLLSHKLSPVKTAKNSTTNCFDCPLQTNQNDAVRLVCYSLRKRINLQQAYEKRSPIKITETKRNTAKRTTADKEEYTIIKPKNVTPATLEFPSDESCVSNLLTVVDAFNANVYQSVDLKVKNSHKK